MELIRKKVDKRWVKDFVTNNTRIAKIEEVSQKNIKDKKEAFQKDKSKNRNLTKESTTMDDIVHRNRNENITRNKSRSYTKNTKPTQNPRCNHLNYNTHYKRYKFNETNN